MLGHEKVVAERLPEEWCEVLGLTILDADGFRDPPGRPESGPRPVSPWETRMTLDEFVYRYRQCTVRPGLVVVKQCVRIERPVVMEVFMEGSGDPSKHHEIIGVNVVEPSGVSHGIGRIPEADEDVKEV